MNPRLQKARADAQRRRIVYLLELVAKETGADVSHQEQCENCGEYFKQPSSHRPHCGGPE